MTAIVRVQLLDVPVSLMFRANQHQQELVREFTLIQLSDDGAKRDVPLRLLDVVERDRGEFSELSVRLWEELAEAMERGDQLIDMEIEIPSAARAAAEELLATLTEADEFCRRGDLLTLATPPDLVTFREWFLGEVVRQIDGAAPTPWRERAEA
jgi:hypothetical protein